MIKLEHVTTDKIIFAGYISTAYAVDIKMFLIRNGIEDYQALKDFLESGKKVVGREFLEERLQLVEDKLRRDNDLGLEPQIFTTNGYQNVDLKSIKKSEGKNKGNILLFKSPAVCHSGKKGKISNLTVHNIKHLLSHVKPDKGTNALLGTLSGYGDLAGERLLLSLNFFEDQITRQARETNEEDRNLFIINQQEKREIVEEGIKGIIEYLVDNSDICIWGELTQVQKRVYLESISGRNSEKHRIVRKNMIDVITNYTTLSEIKDGVKEKTLDRFIIK